MSKRLRLLMENTIEISTFNKIKEKYVEYISKNLPVYNLHLMEVSEIFVILELFESFKNKDEKQVKKILADLSEEGEKRLLELIELDHVLRAVSSFVKNKITAEELLSLFDGKSILKDGL